MVKFVVDGGHGFNTSGKRTPSGEREWTFNDKLLKGFVEEISKYMNVELKRVDDPTGKTDVSLAARVNAANTWKADYYISFHHNANTGKWGSWGGVETHVYLTPNAASLALAKAVQPALVKGYGLRDRGVKKTNLYVTRQTKMPAILIEGGFMDSTTDIAKLRDDKVLANTGKLIAQAVAAHLGLKLKPVAATNINVNTKVDINVNTHTVVKGDTLYSIATKYKLSVADLKALNGLKSDVLNVGVKLKVSKAVTHTVVKGDTLYSIATKYGVKVEAIQSINGMKGTTITAGQVLKIK